LDAFWRCEHTCARLTRDMLEAWEPAVGGGGRVCANARRVLGQLALQWLALALVGQRETAWRWWIDYGSRCTALGTGRDVVNWQGRRQQNFGGPQVTGVAATAASCHAF
jgi:hypothetical protein